MIINDLMIIHSVITDDDIALDVIQNENWQYFF